MTETKRPMVLILTEDLFLTPRLVDGVRQLDFDPLVVESPADLKAEGSATDRPVPLTEPLSGADANLVRALSQLRPALILVDLSASKVPWERWIQVIKTSAATRRIPVLAFGPHVEERAFQRAEQAGANLTVPRSRLHTQLPNLVQDHARTTDFQLLESSCEEALSDLALKGVRLHNQGEYFEAHEELEHAWMAEQGEAGFLYRALLQVTVAYLHIERGNYRGARKMLLRVRQWLDPLPAACRGVDVEELRAMVQRLRESLLALEPDQLAELDRSRLGPFPLLESAVRSADS